MELQQRTGSGGHIPVDDGLVSLHLMMPMVLLVEVRRGRVYH